MVLGTDSVDDDSILFIIGPLIGGLILYAIMSALVRAPGALLRHKFEEVGTLRGQSLNTIVAIVGPPSARSVTASGKTLYQWMATGYHIALLFEGDVCEGVTHEFTDLPGRSSAAAPPLAAVSPPSPQPRVPAKPAEPESIPCPLCGQHIRISTLKQGENWCPHCFEKFNAE